MTTKNLKDLYTRSIQLEREILVLSEDLKELRGEYTYDKEYNVEGHPKEEVTLVMKAAKSKAKEENLQEKVDTLNEIVGIQEQYD